VEYTDFSCLYCYQNERKKDCFVCLFDGFYRHFQQYFSYIVAVSFIGKHLIYLWIRLHIGIHGNRWYSGESGGKFCYA
jgi:hypothetical protein